MARARRPRRPRGEDLTDVEWRFLNDAIAPDQAGVQAWALTYGVGVTPRDAAFYGADFAGVPIDPDDRPQFESQVTYLARHGLLCADERRRLTRADFEPETVSFRN
jgi:hypothetical protein